MHTGDCPSPSRVAGPGSGRGREGILPPILLEFCWSRSRVDSSNLAEAIFPGTEAQRRRLAGSVRGGRREVGGRTEVLEIHNNSLACGLWNERHVGQGDPGAAATRAPALVSSDRVAPSVEGQRGGEEASGQVRSSGHWLSPRTG